MIEHEPTAEKSRRSRKWWLMAGALAVMAAVAGGSTAWWAWQSRHPFPQLPAATVEKVLYPVYLPRRLPEGFAIAAASATVQDEALLFAAKHESGRQIAFTEQARPKDFDFAAFYQQQLRGVKNLQHVPYPSVLGTTDTGARLLSITTDTTWLIITSKTASEDEMRLIAETLHKR